VQTYSFTYNQTPLPPYLTTNTDHWGFNNNNTTIIAVGANNNLAQIRAPDPTGVQTQAEILTGITYPTGGTTNFIYEPNTYSSAINRSSGVSPTVQTGIAGGLRIKQIISNDNNGNSLTKKYFYVNGFTPTATLSSLPSSGVLNSIPIYNFTITGTDLGGTNTFGFTSISSNPIIPLTTTGTGTHIGYSNVVEQLADGSYTIYNFTNHDNGYQDLAPLSNFNPNAIDYFQSTSLDFERGRLLQKTDYNKNGNIVSQATTTYSSNVTYYTTPAPTLSAHAVLSSLLGICNNNSVGAVSRTAYLINYFPFVPVTQTNNTYGLTGSGNNISATTNTTYDQYKNIIEQDITNSDGTVQKVRYHYSYNFATSSTTNPYTMMDTLNMNNKVIEKINSVVINGVESVTGGEVHTYQLYGAGQFYNDAVYNFEAVSPVLYTGMTATAYSGITTNGQLAMDSHYVLRESFFYDNAGNLNSTLDDAGHSTAYLWDINKGKLVAKVLNATSSNIAYTSFEYNQSAELTNGGGNWSGINNNLSSIVTNGTGLTGHNYYTLTGNTLTSPALNPSQTYIVSYWSNNSSPYTVSGTQSTTQGLTLPSGWTYFQHVVTNASSVSVTGTGSIDELRLYPQGAQMTTYTWEPLVGIKAIADPKSQISYYTYDPFQRLSTIADQTGSIIKAYGYNYAVTSNQPVITGLSASGTTITVNFNPVSDCTGTQVNWTDITTHQTGQINNGCTSPLEVTVPNTGHTYTITVKCTSTFSTGGVTSAPMNISN